MNFASLDTKIGPNVKKIAPAYENGLNTPKKSSKPKHEKSKKNELVDALNSFYNSARVKLSNSFYLFWVNRRLRYGILILLIIAPVSKFLYLLFPEDGFGEYFVNTEWFTINNFIENPHWYYQNLHWYIWSVGEICAPLLSIIGIFLLFPEKYYPSYLTGVPFGYYLALMVNRMTATNYQEFHGGIATSVLLMYLIFGVILFAVSDKLLFNTNHRKRAIEARIIGLINMPGMSWEDKEELLRKEAKRAMKQNNEIFNNTA